MWEKITLRKEIKKWLRVRLIVDLNQRMQENSSTDGPRLINQMGIESKLLKDDFRECELNKNLTWYPKATFLILK